MTGTCYRGGTCTIVLSAHKRLKYLDFVRGVHRELTEPGGPLYIIYRDSMHSTSRQVLIVLGISLAKRVICNMTTRVLNVILTDGTMPNYTTHAIAANSCALQVLEHPRQDYEQLHTLNRNPACAYSGYRHEHTLLANKLSKLKFSLSR